MAVSKSSRKLAVPAPPIGGAGTAEQVKEALTSLEKAATAKDRDNLAKFGITAKKAHGVSMANIQALAKRLGRSHDLALALWATGWYEARLLACYVDEPGLVTRAQMDAWCRDFDNWGICDTACFVLFDRSAHAWSRIEPWCGKKDEYGKRAGFALMACLALHDKSAGKEAFLRWLPLLENGATDERNFVKKAVVWALKGMGRRPGAVREACVELAERLAASGDATARWVGKDALRDLRKARPVRKTK